ncbi:MAG: hypothetical protein OEZ33_05210 [Gammaproteobacteria bacterium]|nr:hypothetical protein [Gammaproteobacteria bacterium]MDH5777588.1 hypothetical protein [Gammaproteobacteria bacterium]
MTNELALQLITVELENGKQGVFIGGPLVANDCTEDDYQVDSIWFSDIQEVPQNITLSELLSLVKSNLCQQSKMLN